jgi:DNA mismatch endonuclease (patch repair protein)
MTAIRAKNTKSALTLRAALHRAGATGYWLHRKDIPGRRDVAFARCGVAESVEEVF